MLSNEYIELALPFGLLLCVGLAPIHEHAGHVLNDEQAQGIARMVEEIRLDLNLFLESPSASFLLRCAPCNITYVLADHVHSQALQELKVENESLEVRSKVQAVGPVALVERAELEDELAVQKRPPYAVDDARGNSAESGVALDDIVSQTHRDVVQVGRVGRPQLRGVDGEVEGVASGALLRRNNIAILENRELHGHGLVGGAEDGDIDF